MTDRRQDPMFRELVRAQLSRRSVLRGAGGAGVAAALAACGTGDTGTSSKPDPTVKDKSATDKVVRWANWPAYLDYDDKTKNYPTLDKFQQETGIKATYAEDIDDNDSYYGKVQGQLKNGDDIGKDVIVLTDWMAARMIRQGYVQELDQAKIPNAKNLNPKLQDVDFDAGPQALPHLAERVRRHRLPQGQGRSRAQDPRRPLGPRPQGQDRRALRDARHGRADHDVAGRRHLPGVLRGRLQQGSRRAAEAGRLRADPAGQGQLVPRRPAQRQRHRGHRLVRRHPARAVRGGGPQLHLHPAGDRRHAVVGQPHGPDRVAAQGERREADGLLLPARRSPPRSRPTSTTSARSTGPRPRWRRSTRRWSTAR